MTNKSRKHMWPVSLVMSMAIIGALAAFIVLANNPGATMAHGDVDDHAAACAAMTDADRDAHNAAALLDGGEICGTAAGNGDTETAAVPGFAIQHGGEAQQVSVDWDAVTDAHEYIVEYRECSADPCSGAFTTVNLTAANTSYLITGLTAGSQYQVRVTARNAAGMVLAQSTALAPTSRYLLTFANDGVSPLRGHDQDFTPTAAAGADTTVTATVWVPTTTDPDRTDTVTVQFMSMDDSADPLKYYGIDVDDREQFTTLGLLAVSGTGTGHGELTIRPRDNNRRSFDMTFECTLPATKVYVIIYDDEVNVVERGSVTLLCPAPALPTGETAGPECYSVTGKVDQMRDDLDLHATIDGRTINSAAGARGITTNATTGKQEITNRRAEIGQDTTEVLVNTGSVQLTVTSCEAGPVYIRFLDSDMNVFGTDVDECDSCPNAAGADVVGLDSQGKLEMNVGPTVMNGAMALMYDQYSLKETAMSSTSWVQYLQGNAGSYHQGKFRFFDPCPAVGDHFFVEVYEKFEKGIRKLENGMTREMVTCVPSLQPTAKDLTITFTTADKLATTRGAVMTWEPIADAATYTALVIDPSNATNYTIHGGANGIKMVEADADLLGTEFEDLVIGRRYIFALYATLDDGTYSDLKFDRLTP